MISSKTLLSTAALTIGYRLSGKENRLFKNLRLELPAGKLVCFMGPNGIGKSTLIRTLAGLQKPLSGIVEIHSDSTADLFSKRISVVLTDKITATNMTVYDVVSYGRYPYLTWSIDLSESDKKIIDTAIRQVRIGHLVNHKIHTLSDGQMQMVMIARALAQDTGIILLDEPTAHLDLHNRLEIMKLLRELTKRTNKAILVASHELDLALQLADLVWLADKNRSILTGVPEDLVLNGSFDRIFAFKGFDLKTGKILHEPQTGKIIQLIGAGPDYLWTKNALERSGFEVIQEGCNTSVTVLRKADVAEWHVEKSGLNTIVNSLSELLNLL